MLNRKETKATAAELQENYTRLSYPSERVLSDLKISQKDLDRALAMKHPNPAHVWMLREYLEDMLVKDGKEVYPFSKLADPAVNLWYPYDRPWREMSL